MADQIVLAWTVNVAGSILSPAEAATRLGAVQLYTEAESDPVLGQFLGLTVGTDVTTNDAVSATRTLTLNMTADGAAAAIPAPPLFSCSGGSPNEGEAEPPYRFVTSVLLPGSFVVTNGSTGVTTTTQQLASLAVGDRVVFPTQPGTFYEIGVITATTLTLLNPYTGVSTTTSAAKLKTDPATIVAIYSTSPLDTSGESSVTPAVLAGPGARTVTIEYDDSLGAGPFTITGTLRGKKPALLTLDPGSADMAVVNSMFVATEGTFDNSVGQITLVELSAQPPSLPNNPTREDLRRITDETQMLITRSLVYLPPSYFALAAQGAATPALEGDFFVTTGSRVVLTSIDQTGALAPGDVIQFASQLTINSPVGTTDVFYTVETVGAGDIKLTAPYTGVDENFTGNGNANTNMGTKGNLGATVTRKATAAMLIDPASVVPPSNAALSAMLGQHVTTQVAVPPPDPPFPPATVPTPTFLSNLFTHTIQLALAGVPITPAAITLLP